VGLGNLMHLRKSVLHGDARLLLAIPSYTCWAVGVSTWRRSRTTQAKTWRDGGFPLAGTEHRQGLPPRSAKTDIGDDHAYVSTLSTHLDAILSPPRPAKHAGPVCYEANCATVAYCSRSFAPREGTWATMAPFLPAGTQISLGHCTTCENMA